MSRHLATFARLCGYSSEVAAFFVLAPILIVVVLVTGIAQAGGCGPERPATVRMASASADSDPPDTASR